MQRGKKRTVTASLIHIVLNLYAKFEVSSCNHSGNISGSRNSKSGSRDRHITPFDLILYFLVLTVRPCLCQI